MPPDDTIHIDAGVCDAIDDALQRFHGRALVSGSEVVDLLLDLRVVVDAERRFCALLTSTGS